MVCLVGGAGVALYLSGNSSGDKSTSTSITSPSTGLPSEPPGERSSITTAQALSSLVAYINRTAASPRTLWREHGYSQVYDFRGKPVKLDIDGSLVCSLAAHCNGSFEISLIEMLDPGNWKKTESIKVGVSFGSTTDVITEYDGHRPNHSDLPSETLDESVLQGAQHTLGLNSVVQWITGCNVGRAATWHSGDQSWTSLQLTKGKRDSLCAPLRGLDADMQYSDLNGISVPMSTVVVSVSQNRITSAWIAVAGITYVITES